MGIVTLFEFLDRQLRPDREVCSRSDELLSIIVNIRGSGDIAISCLSCTISGRDIDSIIRREYDTIIGDELCILDEIDGIGCRIDYPYFTFGRMTDVLDILSVDRHIDMCLDRSGDEWDDDMGILVGIVCDLMLGDITEVIRYFIDRVGRRDRDRRLWEDE